MANVPAKPTEPNQEVEKESTIAAPPAATGDGRAQLSVTVGSASLFPDSTYNGGSIEIENQSSNGVEITQIVIDLTSAFIPDELFDPATDPVTGESLPAAGDSAQKDFEFWAAGSLGLDPQDVTVRFAAPGDGAGFGQLILTFAPGSFAPNDVLAFSIDIDAASAFSHDAGGGVAGQQLAGSLFTVNFSDGTSATGTLSPEADNTSGATAVAHVGSNQTAPTLTLADGSTGPISTDNAIVDILIDAGSENAGSTVRIFILDTAYYTPNSGPAPVAFTGNQLNKNAIAIDVILDANGRYSGTIPVTRTDNTSTSQDDANLGINRIGATLIDANGDEGPFSATLTVQLEDGATPPTPTENTIVATNAAEILEGTDANDTFVFADGTSTSAATDTIVFFEPGDTIDLSDWNLTADDLETRLISGGNAVKLIEGFSPGDFQLKINLGGASVDEVLNSIIFDGSSPPPPPPPPGDNTIVATEALENLMGTSSDDVFVFGPGTSTSSSTDTILNFEIGDTIDLSELGITEDDLETRLISDGGVLKLIEGFGSNDFQLKINLNNVSVEDVLAALVFDCPETVTNTVLATDASEYLSGLHGYDIYIFKPGTSTGENIDTIIDWSEGDVIDLSALGVSIDDLDARLVADGTILKLIEGFEPGDFQLKINMNGYSAEQILSSVRVESLAEIQATKPPAVYEVATSEAFDFSELPPSTEPSEPEIIASEHLLNRSEFMRYESFDELVLIEDDFGMLWIEA